MTQGTDERDIAEVEAIATRLLEMSEEGRDFLGQEINELEQRPNLTGAQQTYVTTIGAALRWIEEGQNPTPVLSLLVGMRRHARERREDEAADRDDLLRRLEQ